MQPLYINVHAHDNVAIVANAGGLPTGTVFACGLELQEHVPQGHKVALTDLGQDEAIIRYGEVIGYAARPLQKGSWINESHVRMPVPPALDQLPIATCVPAPLPPLEGYTFEGYRNPDGSVAVVHDVVALNHSYGCGVAIDAPEAVIPSARFRTWPFTRTWVGKSWS